MVHNPTFLASIEFLYMRLFNLYGLDEQAFADLNGKTRERNPNARLDVDVADNVFRRAITLIPDPAFGLRAGECWHPSNLGALGYAWLSSASLRDGLNRVQLYSQVIGQAAEYRIEESADSVKLVINNTREASELAYVLADCSLSILMAMCRINAGSEFRPSLVRMKRPPPAQPEIYSDFFGCPVLFNAGEVSFEIGRAVAEAALPTSNFELALAFDAILSKQLGQLNQADVVSQIKAFLLNQLTAGEPSERGLCKSLGMSQRSLQRKLAEQNTTYKQVLDGVRYDIAKSYLSESSHTATEITFLLGFSDLSAFTRAFKRWHGQSPSEFRAVLANRPIGA